MRGQTLTVVGLEAKHVRIRPCAPPVSRWSGVNTQRRLTRHLGMGSCRAGHIELNDGRLWKNHSRSHVFGGYLVLLLEILSGPHVYHAVRYGYEDREGTVTWTSMRTTGECSWKSVICDALDLQSNISTLGIWIT